MMMRHTIPWSKRPVVISGPSGSGKSTLLKMLFEKHGDQLGYCVSHTTRSPRAGEVQGKSYHFIAVDDFQHMIEKNQFIEWAIYSKHYYGTSISSLETVLAAGKIPLLDIDLAGVKSVKVLADRIPARFVFIRTNDMATLEQRLRVRDTETEESLLRRLHIAKAEIDHADTFPETHDIVIVNEDIQTAYTALESFIFQEKDM